MMLIGFIINLTKNFSRMYSMIRNLSLIPMLALLGLLVMPPEAAAQTPSDKREIQRMTHPTKAETKDLIDSKFIGMPESEFSTLMGPYGFEWTAETTHNSARVSPSFLNNKHKLSFNGLSASETLVNFRDGKVFNAQFMLYSKGDDGELMGASKEGAFMSKVTAAKANLDALCPDFKLANEGKNLKKASGATGRSSYFWVKNDLLYRLDFVANRDRNGKFMSADYIRLNIAAGHDKMTILDLDKNDVQAVAQADRILNVKREEDGTVWIDGVPMIDQGQKGYCACASVARILNFYGRDTDMHEIAKIAKSTGEGGTDPELLAKSLKDIATKFRITLEPKGKYPFASQREYTRFIHDLEKEFKKRGETLPDSIEKTKLAPMILEITSKSTGQRAIFDKAIIEAINKGRPMAWALQLGFFPEPDVPQADGGHMRLIIGYRLDEKKKLTHVIYSDSWGKKHEKKERSADEAFAVTCALWDLRVN